MDEPMRSYLAVALLSASLILPGIGKAGEPAAELYGKYCSVCHGDKGDGRSRARGSLVPPPRDFTTPEAAVELGRERMIASVTEGRPGTAMAAWKTQLSAAQIAGVVDYIRTTLMRPVATVDAGAARRLYAENCSVCHGDDGRGARWTLTNLVPPPRNFTLPGTAQALSRDYMLQVVTYGKADTAMPGFGSQLDSAEIAKVVDFVRAAFMKVEPGPPDAAQSPPPVDLAAGLPNGLTGDPASGQAFYLHNCVACHGVDGDGKGPRAYFILPKPRNFRHPGSRHSFTRARLYQAIARGIRGSDMPAWDTVLTPQEIANLAEYVFQAFIRSEPEPPDQSAEPDKG
jgi:mono/diheme cytochrome c family protein